MAFHWMIYRRLQWLCSIMAMHRREFQIVNSDLIILMNVSALKTPFPLLPIPSTEIPKIMSRLQAVADLAGNLIVHCW